MIKRQFYLIFCLLIIYSCESANKTGNSAISGKVKNAAAGSKLFLEHILPTGAQTIDTAVLSIDGDFAFAQKVNEVGFFRIKQDEQNFITLIINPGDKAIVNATWNLSRNPYTVTGSEESVLLKSINEQMSGIYHTRDSLNGVYQVNSENKELLVELQQIFTELVKNNTEFVKQFILDHPSSFACLAAAEQLNAETDREYFNMVDDGLAKKYGNSPYYKDFHNTLAKLFNLAVGTQAPDIILPNAQGEIVSLSSMKGKVVLVDFWASWCRPCRMENPNIVRAYKEFKSKGFEVFGVSLDKEKESWLAAIQQDQLHWTQVSDLGFWASPVVKLYDISGIPFAVLLDREGKIIAKNLRGQELIDKLNEVLSK